VGFIEVHHTELVARLAPGTILDPAIDLVPLCSNCHSVAHKRKDTPYTVDEIKAMIEAARNSNSAT
jgi:5-methylcytosine-specific restriction protein A